MRLFFSVLSVLILFTTNVRAENWPQWRGARSDGISTEKNIPTKWSKSENIAWRTPMPGQAGATPCVWGDRIYATSADKNDLVLLCLNTVDGKVLWKQTVCTGNQDARAGEGNSASPSPSTDGEHVWVFFGTGVLGCYSKEGKEVWKYKPSAESGKAEIHAFRRLDNGLTMVAESGTTRIIEVNKEGSIVHSTPLKVSTPDPHRDTRLVRITDAGTYLVAHEGEKLIREYNRDGAIVWEYEVGSQLYSAVRLGNGNTLIGTGDGHRA